MAAWKLLATGWRLAPFRLAMKQIYDLNDLPKTAKKPAHTALTVMPENNPKLTSHR